MVHGATMGPIWVLSSPGGPHVIPMYLAVWVALQADWYVNPSPTAELPLQRASIVKSFSKS